MTTTDHHTTTSTPTVKLLLLKRAQIFWMAFSVIVLSVSVAFIAAYNFGIATGFEGRPVFNGSRLGEAMGYLFGGAQQFLAFVGVLALIGIALRWTLKLSRGGHDTAVLAVIVAAFIVGGLTFKFLAVGENIVPLLVITTFAAAMAAVLTALLAIRERANH